MKIEVNHHCSDFNSYRAARVKSLFNAENGCDWSHTAELPIENMDCEQEIVKIDYGLRPREFYQSDIIPAMLRTLKRCLNNLQNGIIRRIPQVEKYSTYDAKIQASTK